MAKAMGLNTVCTYAFWNVHEPKPGVWDFSGNLDIAKYVHIAGEEGLKVIVRPGPYVCTEWDLGGIPAWTLKDRAMRIRSKDPKFMALTQAYFNALGERLKPLLVQNGGPIIMTQVENEYGSYGSDHEYMGESATPCATQASQDSFSPRTALARASFVAAPCPASPRRSTSAAVRRARSPNWRSSARRTENDR